VDGMTTAGGYNFNYGPVNVAAPADWVLPQVFTTFPEASTSGLSQMAQKQTQAWPFIFRIVIAKGAGSIEVEIAKVTEDFIKLMDTQADALKAAGVLISTLVSVRRQYRLVTSSPVELFITYNFTIRQSRSNPAIP
jgi:hypothetical protein